MGRPRHLPAVTVANTDQASLIDQRYFQPAPGRYPEFTYVSVSSQLCVRSISLYHISVKSIVPTWANRCVHETGTQLHRAPLLIMRSFTQRRIHKSRGAELGFRIGLFIASRFLLTCVRIPASSFTSVGAATGANLN